MLRLGFIGFGQGGGAFVEAAKEFGYDCLAVNSASIDLACLSKLTAEEKFHLSGYEGAGKDRAVGREAFIDHEEAIRKRLSELFRDCQVLFPAFALGGGTGSGSIGPALDLLTSQFDSKLICPILFFPSADESPRSKMNALEAFSECTENEDLGACFFFDNTRILHLQSSCSLTEKYLVSHRDFLETLHHLNGRTSVASSIANLDKTDLLTLLSERGSSILASVPLQREQLTDADQLKEQLLANWHYTSFCETDFHAFSRAGFVLECPAEHTRQLAVEPALQAIGTPLEIFTGYYESSEAIRSVQLLTGLPFPETIAEELEKSIRKKEERLIQRAEQNRQQKYKVNNSWSSPLSNRKRIQC